MGRASPLVGIAVLGIGICVVLVGVLVTSAMRGAGSEPFANVTPPLALLASNAYNIGDVIAADTVIQSFATVLWPTLLQIAPAAPPGVRANVVEVLCDPNDAAKHYAARPRRPAARAGHFMLISSVATHPDIGALPWNGKLIGYTDRSELLMALSLLYAFRVPLNSVRLVWVAKAYHDRLAEVLVPGTLDFIVAYVVRDTPFHQSLKKQRVMVGGFQGADVEAGAADVYAESLLNRVRVSYASAKRAIVPLRDWWTPSREGEVANVVTTVANGNGAELIEMTQMWVALTTTKDVAEGFLMPYTWDADALDPRFECVGGAPNTSKADCDSANDVVGLPKRKATVWDRPCEEDGDCQHSAACNNGYCDMPVGVTRASYRKEAPGGNPLCYGCEDPWDASCCEGLSNAVYAFASDGGKVDLSGMADQLLAAEDARS